MMSYLLHIEYCWCLVKESLSILYQHYNQYCCSSPGFKTRDALYLVGIGGMNDNLVRDGLTRLIYIGRKHLEVK